MEAPEQVDDRFGGWSDEQVIEMLGSSHVRVRRKAEGVR